MPTSGTISGTIIRMAFPSGKVLYAKSSNIDVSLSTQEVSNKDIGGGDWTSAVGDKLSFSGGVEFDLGYDETYSSEARVNYNDLFALMIAKAAVEITMGTEVLGDSVLVGNALITNLSQSAADGELAQGSCQITGTGSLALVENV